MIFKKWLGVALLAAPALTQETLGCDCVAPTVTQYITVAGPTVTLCPDAVSASQAITSSSTVPYMCAGDPCTSWVGGHSPASTDIVTFKPTTVTQYPVPQSLVPTISSTSRRTKTFTVQTSTIIPPSTTDEDCDTDAPTATAAPVTVTVTTEPEPESTTTVIEFSTTTEHLTTTRTHGGPPFLTTAHLSFNSSSGHHSSFAGFGGHGWNLTASTAHLNGTALQTHRPSHGGHYTPSAKWNTVTLSWGASRNSSPGQTSMATPISPVHSHKPSAMGWSVSFNTTTHHVPLPIHSTSAAIAPPYANHTSAHFVKRNATVPVHAPILSATGCPVSPEELGNFVYGHQPSYLNEVNVKALTRNRLSANGYARVDDAGSETSFMFMPALMEWYEAAYSVFPGGIGAGNNRAHDYFHFDAFGASVACASEQCQIRVVGYALNPADGSEAEKVSAWYTIGGCHGMKNGCEYSAIEFTPGFRDLTSIVILASSIDKTFYMDKLELGWTMQDCESAMKRHGSE
ncbi:hypothetical protein BC567DRAFT_295449 [Phyllosticta citribraziliensis]